MVEPLSRGRKVVNYVSQLRPYSYADLVLLLGALSASRSDFVQCSLLWFGFLIFLEWWHKDDGRLPWPWFAWVITWMAAVAINPTPHLFAFALVAIVYSAKKRLSAVAVVSPIVNGAVKGSLALLIAGTSWETALIVTTVMAARNLAGDFRDTVKDRAQGVQTVPVRLGITRDIKRLYPAALASTSVFWVVWGGLPAWSVLPVWFIEATTYGLTPR
jgi:1,4-dihydroxy-2-naphthoate octaprenyltransferase